MQTYQQFLLDNEEKLDLYTQAIAKVHRKNHPEVKEVKALYEQLLSQVKAGAPQSDVTKTFDQLSEVTQAYQIPSDTCETFEAVYLDLAQADQLYRRELAV